MRRRKKEEMQGHSPLPFSCGDPWFKGLRPLCLCRDPKRQQGVGASSYTTSGFQKTGGSSLPWETGTSGEEGTPPPRLWQRLVPINALPVFPYRVTLILSLEQLQPCEQTGEHFLGDGVERLPLLNTPLPFRSSEIGTPPPSPLPGAELPLLPFSGLLFIFYRLLDTLFLRLSPHPGGRSLTLGCP